MGKTRQYEPFYIICYTVIAPLDQCECLSRTKQSEGTPRADAELEQLGSSRQIDYLQQIVEQRFIKADRADAGLQFQNVRARHNGLERFQRITSFAIA